MVVTLKHQGGLRYVEPGEQILEMERIFEIEARENLWSKLKHPV